MAETQEDPLKETIHQAAALVDVEAARTQEDSQDPMVRLFQQELRNGTDAEEALTNVIDRLASVGGTILGMLDFPPSAVTSYSIIEKLKEEGVSEVEMDAAMSSLQASGQVGEINGWFFKEPKPLVDVSKLTDDDIDWLHGTGRFAQ